MFCIAVTYISLFGELDEHGKQFCKRARELHPDTIWNVRTWTVLQDKKAFMFTKNKCKQLITIFSVHICPFMGPLLPQFWTFS